MLRQSGEGGAEAGRAAAGCAEAEARGWKRHSPGRSPPCRPRAGQSRTAWPRATGGRRSLPPSRSASRRTGPRPFSVASKRPAEWKARVRPEEERACRWGGVEPAETRRALCRRGGGYGARRLPARSSWPECCDCSPSSRPRPRHCPTHNTPARAPASVRRRDGAGSGPARVERARATYFAGVFIANVDLGGAVFPLRR